jgi:hypothetical protein
MPTGNTYPVTGPNITPASGPIKFSDLNKAFQRTAGTSIAMSWVKDRQKVPKNKLSEDYSQDYFKRNIDGNCDNGNCTDNADPGGVFNCVNCRITGAINCTNCDATSLLQTNCNCACTYNCTQTTVTYNCNCVCLCACWFSDDALKNRLENIANPLEMVRELNGFYYTGNKIAKAMGLKVERDVGVSAQDIERVMPEVLGPSFGDENYKSVHYEKLVPLLIEAIKELDKQVNKK